MKEEFFKSAEREGDKIFFGIGLIGAAFLAYKIFFDPNKSEEEDEVPEAPEETRKVTVDSKESQPPKEPKNPPEPVESSAPTPRKPKGKTRGYEPYTME